MTKDDSKYRVVLITGDIERPCRGSKNRNLSYQEALDRIEDKQSSSKTAIGRAGTDAYRYNRKHPNGWYLDIAVETK